MLNLKSFLILLSLLMISKMNLCAIDKVQEIHLKKGWNAIYLEVDPFISSQNISDFISKTVDGNSTIPIEIITTYLPSESSVEYIDTPDEEVWKKPSWNSWVRDDFPESFLTNLYDLEAGQAYLVRSSQDFIWKIKGEVRNITTDWKSNSFNFVGFQVSETPISFHQFFQKNTKAETLKNGPIYSLVDGKWKEVSLVDTIVGKGNSYWVLANGSSTFNGSVDLALDDGTRIMNFSDIANYKTIVLTNNSSITKNITLSLETNEVPLSLVESNDLSEQTYTPVTTTIKTIDIPANSQVSVVVAIRRSEITTKGKKEGILKMEVKDTHEVQYLPIVVYGDNQ